MTRYHSRPNVLVLFLTLAAAAANGAEIPDRLASGAELFETAEYTEALQFFTSVSRDSDGAWVDYFLGRIELQQGDTDAAIEQLSGAVEAEPDSTLFHRWLGEAYVEKIDQVGMLKKLGVAKKARTSFERAVELSPGDFAAREALFSYYLNAPSIAGGSRDKAEEQVAEMTRLDPSKGHLLKGRLYTSDDDWGAAAREFQLAIEAGDEGSEAYYRLGFALQQAENYKAAFEAFEQAIEADPADLGAYYQIGRTAIFSKSQLDRAVETLSFYLEQPQQRGSPAAEHAHWRLGMVYQLQSKRELAAVEYQAALELDPDHEEAKKALKALKSS